MVRLLVVRCRVVGFWNVVSMVVWVHVMVAMW